MAERILANSRTRSRSWRRERRKDNIASRIGPISLQQSLPTAVIVITMITSASRATTQELVASTCAFGGLTTASWYGGDAVD